MLLLSFQPLLSLSPPPIPNSDWTIFDCGPVFIAMENSAWAMTQQHFQVFSTSKGSLIFVFRKVKKKKKKLRRKHKNQAYIKIDDIQSQFLARGDRSCPPAAHYEVRVLTVLGVISPLSKWSTCLSATANKAFPKKGEENQSGGAGHNGGCIKWIILRSSSSPVQQVFWTRLSMPKKVIFSLPHCLSPYILFFPCSQLHAERHPQRFMN